MPHDQHQDIDPADLPPVITRYLAAHRTRDTATALTTLTPDASVTDDGKTYEGIPAIGTWLDRATGEYTYTTELTGAQRVDPAHYIATHHLEGNFPGGQVDLHFRFTLRGELIEQLVIEP
ncbi:nuclear transport factor 2 family protein [Streptomyces bauhiniae]|uniref:nuclear transport factor 2 family protein n=1 Tax=Streptomyces bauhiniae TaxID=2340725 RepID=UPI0037D96D27